MIGSFIGDIVGSIYEFSNIKTKCFPFYGPTEGALFFTDDSVLTGATAYWILHGGNIGAHYAQFAVSNPGEDTADDSRNGSACIATRTKWLRPTTRWATAAACASALWVGLRKHAKR